MSDTTYTRIPATEARAGDEVYSAALGTWDPITAAYVHRDTVKFVYPSGATHSAPAHHHMVRRPAVLTVTRCHECGSTTEAPDVASAEAYRATARAAEWTCCGVTSEVVGA